ncbi:hypothetical protein L209DRAFT_7655 [Thermothelomyces heterothallicus CBS 203.75]
MKHLHWGVMVAIASSVFFMRPAVKRCGSPDDRQGRNCTAGNWSLTINRHSVRPSFPSFPNPRDSRSISFAVSLIKTAGRAGLVPWPRKKLAERIACRWLDETAPSCKAVAKPTERYPHPAPPPGQLSREE